MSTPQEGSAAANGFQALAELDQPSQGGNANGRIDEGDRVFSRLRGWIDEDHSGTVEPSELYTLPLLRISAIGLTFAHAPLFDGAGNLYQFFGRIWDSAGRPKQVVVDVFLAVQPIFHFPQ